MKREIKYFSFWDVPRTFAFERNGNIYVLVSEFDDELDEYPDEYEAFFVPALTGLSQVTGWKHVEPLPKQPLGKVPIASVKFDKSHRKFVDDAFLEGLLKS